MNSAHFHLLINHLPIVGSFIGFLLVFYSAIVKRNSSNLKAGLVILCLSCLSILPVYFSGEGAEEIVEHLEGVSHDSIEEHEEISELGFYVSLFVALLSGVAFFATNKKNNMAKILTNSTLFASLLLTVLFVFIGNTGGKIRRPEIQQGKESSTDKLAPKLHIHDSDGD